MEGDADYLKFVGVTVLIALAGIYCVYLIIPIDVQVALGLALRRVLWHWYPAVLLLIFLGLRLPVKSLPAWLTR